MDMFGSDMSGMEFPSKFLTFQDDSFERSPASWSVESIRGMAHLLPAKLHSALVGRKKRSPVGIVESIDAVSGVSVEARTVAVEGQKVSWCHDSCFSSHFTYP